LFGAQPCSEVGGHLYRRVLVFLHADINPLDYDDQKGRELIERAMNGDTDADAALCGIASRLVRLGDPLPKYLRDYISTILKFRFAAPPKRRKGGDPYARDRRNLFIVTILKRLRGSGVPPTRNRAARDNGTGRSGCSIVAKALSEVGVHIDETGVEKIWAARTRYTVRR
jgi:hypothetical protein